MFTKTIENTSPKRQRVNESQSAHSLALRACMKDKPGAVQIELACADSRGKVSRSLDPKTQRRIKYGELHESTARTRCAALLYTPHEPRRARDYSVCSAYSVVKRIEAFFNIELFNAEVINGSKKPASPLAD